MVVGAGAIVLFIALVLGMMVCFWGLATVCEEFFVPALNLVCEKFNIPDDVAGATLMAAGASSPECFTSLIALFVTHSEVGIGTVIGSEIFNHLGICAGSILYARGTMLQLAPAIVLRDVLFYALALGMLLWALRHKVDLSDDNDPTTKNPHISVTWCEAHVSTAHTVDADLIPSP